jgi:predicted nucleic acid-binding protein
VNYLDASAAVKLVLDEPGSNHLKNYFDEHSGFRITSLCLLEALGVLKRKWQRKRILKKDYFDKCYLLLSKVRGKPKFISDPGPFRELALIPASQIQDPKQLLR